MLSVMTWRWGWALIAWVFGPIILLYTLINVCWLSVEGWVVLRGVQGLFFGWDRIVFTVLIFLFKYRFLSGLIIRFMMTMMMVVVLLSLLCFNNPLYAFFLNNFRCLIVRLRIRLWCLHILILFVVLWWFMVVRPWLNFLTFERDGTPTTSIIFFNPLRIMLRHSLF